MRDELAYSAPLSGEGLAQLWDFDDAAGSCLRFEIFTQRAINSGVCELAAWAQIQRARGLGLQRRFDEARSLLEQIRDQHPAPDDQLATRLDLELGRVINSAGSPGDSIGYFEHAYKTAIRAGLDGLAVDAAHMLGIVVAGDAGMGWNERALALAQSSSQPAAMNWCGSLLNNMGWSSHDAGQLVRAMELFEQALELRLIEGKNGPIRIARWCIGKCFRSLGKLDKALTIQRSLEVDPRADGYVFEEIGECLLLQGKPLEAPLYFLKAYEMLSADQWLVANESDRLDRLKKLGEV